MANQIEFTRVNNDVNGNPRYVVHFLALFNNLSDYGKLDALMQRHPHNSALECKYEVALKKARKLGGKKFHNKQYGGGIVFQSYNLPDLEKSILELQNA